MSTRPASETDRTIELMALRLNDLPKALGVSRRTIERLRAAGKFPPPDRKIGSSPTWRPDTIRRWVEGGNCS